MQWRPTIFLLAALFFLLPFMQKQCIWYINQSGKWRPYSVLDRKQITTQKQVELLFMARRKLITPVISLLKMQIKIVLTTFSQSGIYTVHAFVQWFIIIACCIICFRDTTKLGAKSSWQIVLKVIISIYLGRCTSNQPCGHLLIKSVLFQPTLIISYK